MTDREFTRQYRIHQWAAAIQDQKTSGLTIAQWCDEHEVSRYQFFYRQKVVRKALADSRELSDLAENVVDAAGKSQPISFAALPANALPDPSGVALRLRRGSSVVEVSNDASDRILSLLREVILHAE